MNTYTLEPMPITLVGEGSVAEFTQHVRAHGSRAFVVSDPGVRAAGIVNTVIDALTQDGLEWTVFDDVDPNPTDANVAAGVESLRGFDSTGGSVPCH